MPFSPAKIVPVARAENAVVAYGELADATDLGLMALNGDDAGLLLNAADLVTYVHAQLDIEVGQRLVEEQRSGLTRWTSRDYSSTLCIDGTTP